MYGTNKCLRFGIRLDIGGSRSGPEGRRQVWFGFAPPGSDSDRRPVRIRIDIGSGIRTRRLASRIIPEPRALSADVYARMAGWWPWAGGVGDRD